MVGFFSFYFAISLRDDAPHAIVLKVEPPNPTIRPGDIVRVRYVVRRLESCAFKVDRTIFDASKGTMGSSGRGLGLGAWRAARRH